MRDEFHEYSSDPSSQKSVTDWLMQVIARKEDAVLHHDHHDEAAKEKARPEQVKTAVQEIPGSNTAPAVNGSNGASLENGHAPVPGAPNGYTPLRGLQIGYEPPAAPETGDTFSVPIQDSPAAPRQNGYERIAASQNGLSHNAPISEAKAPASQNGHGSPQVVDVFGDVFGDVFSTPSQNGKNGNGFGGHTQNGHSSAAAQNGFEFSADDLCGPPAFGPVPKVRRDEITADDLCWIPKPNVTESYRNGNGYHESVSYPVPSAELMPAVASAPEPVMATLVAIEPAVISIEPPVVTQEPQVFETEPNAGAEFVHVPESAAPVVEPFEAMSTAPAIAEPQMPEPQPIAEEPAIEAQPTTTPEQWLERMMAMTKSAPGPMATESQLSAVAEATPVAEVPVVETQATVAPVIEEKWEPLRAPEIVAQPEVIPPDAQVIEAAASAEATIPIAEVVAKAEASVAPEIIAPTETVAEPQVQTAEQVSAAAPTTEATPATEDSTKLVPVDRRKRRRPAVSIADICRDWVIEEMEANGGVPATEEIEEVDDFLAEEDSIVQTPESVFTQEGIWGNTAAPGTAQDGQLPNIPEIESAGAQTQAKAGNRNSSGMKALLRLGTLLPWLAREMEAGNDQNAALTQEVRHEVSGMRLVQYEIRSTVHDHSLQLKRVEEQLTRVREAVTAEQSGTADLVESVKSTTKVVSMVGVGICVMLVAILGLVTFMVMHGR